MMQSCVAVASKTEMSKFDCQAVLSAVALQIYIFNYLFLVIIAVTYLYYYSYQDLLCVLANGSF